MTFLTWTSTITVQVTTRHVLEANTASEATRDVCGGCGSSCGVRLGWRLPAVAGRRGASGGQSCNVTPAWRAQSSVTRPSAHM